MSLRTIVVDDSIIFRKVVRDALAGIEGVEVVEVAKDGLTAVEKITRLKPDLVTLDIEMPGLNGLEVLEELQRRGQETNVIMVSSLTRRGAEVTTEALAKGAFDFILKPASEGATAGVETLRAEFRRRLFALTARGRHIESRNTSEADASVTRATHSAGSFGHASRDLPSNAIRPPSRRATNPTTSFDAIFLGISTGGPNALSRFLPRLAPNFSIPLVIVQHMPPLFTATLARNLDHQCPLRVVEAADEMPLAGGNVYIAPGGKQLSVRSDLHRGLVAIVDEAPPVKCCKPSVDHLMFSVPGSVAARSLAIIMTGMGSDGRDGCASMRRHGATVWAQSAASCTVYGMPRQVIESGLADRTFSLDELPAALNALTPNRVTELV